MLILQQCASRVCHRTAAWCSANPGQRVRCRRTIGATLPSGTPGRRFVRLHGLMTFAVGLMTVGAPALPRLAALAVVSGWLFRYAGPAFAAAIISTFSWRLRVGLVAWGVLDVELALVASLFPEGTIFALLFFGAAYAAAFGVWQIAAGLWVRRLEDGVWGPSLENGVWRTTG